MHNGVPSIQLDLTCLLNVFSYLVCCVQLDIAPIVVVPHDRFRPTVYACTITPHVGKESNLRQSLKESTRLAIQYAVAHLFLRSHLDLLETARFYTMWARDGSLARSRARACSCTRCAARLRLLRPGRAGRGGVQGVRGGGGSGELAGLPLGPAPLRGAERGVGGFGGCGSATTRRYSPRRLRRRDPLPATKLGVAPGPRRQPY